MSIHRKLMTGGVVAVLSLGLAACGTSSDNDTAMGDTAMGDTAMEMGPTAEEQLTALRDEIAALRTQLGITDDDDLGDSISDLQDEVDDLKGKVEKQETDAAADAAKAHAAKLNKLAMGIGAAGASIVAPSSNTKPDNATDGDAPYDISGWNGASYSVANDDRSTTMTVVYNNKEAPTSVTFSKMWGAQDDATPAIRDGSYAFTAMAHGKYVDMAGLPTHTSHDGVAVGPVNGVRGTFNGAPGTFTSDATTEDLTVGIDPKGVPTWSGNLNFEPDSGTAMVMREDDNFLSLGWWLNEAADGDLVPTVMAWTSGTEYSDTGLVSVTGKATFQGIAVGKYTHKTINSIYGGHFDADAKLVADWGDDGEQGTLTGTIDGFEQDGQPLGSGWKVELGAAATDVDGVLTFDPKTGASIASGAVAATGNGALGTFGTQETMGTWSANFQDNSRNDDMPGGVTGAFHVGETGHPINMIGAFAASNQEADQPSN